MGGRGAGKTRAGSEWIRTQVEGAGPRDAGRAKRVALIGETYDQARDIMVFGDSGILACTPPDRTPQWHASKRKLIWPNGAEAQLFSASDPEALRGPQFDCLWADELAKWKKGRAAWDMAQFALRLGAHPRQVITTTPQPVALLKEILAEEDTVLTSAPTSANAMHLAKSFLETVTRRYAGTLLGRQELDGVLLDEIEGALWSLGQFDQHRMEVPPKLDRIIVAIDPAVTSGNAADHCGIIVAGVTHAEDLRDWHAYVLADRTLSGATPQDWARAALAAAQDYHADRIIAEVNQGGDLIETLLHQIDPFAPFKAVRAHHSKTLRAEPVAALYAQGRVHHIGALTDLEDQMAQMTRQGYRGRGSPDRVDALVWALHELMIDAAPQARPRVRVL